MTLFRDEAFAMPEGKPSGGHAVMAQRQADAPNDLDYFPTPPWAARAGGELIRAIDPGARTCWEPAAGGGHMAYALAGYFPGGVLQTDIHAHGPHLALCGDFLTVGGCPGEFEPDWIVTNPPFKLGEAFIRRAWAQARWGVAMLLRLQFAEGVGRHALFTADCPLTVLAPFAERVPMVAGRWDPDASSATAYAWFIFDKMAAPGAEPVVRFVPPGTKARLTLPGDRARFGLAETAAMDLGGGA